MIMEHFSDTSIVRAYTKIVPGMNCYGCQKPVTSENGTHVQRRVGGTWRFYMIHISGECNELLNGRIARGELG